MDWWWCDSAPEGFVTPCRCRLYQNRPWPEEKEEKVAANGRQERVIYRPIERIVIQTLHLG